MRVYAEPDTEESELGFSLFCVRKWAEIWGGDNSDFDFLPTKTGEKSPKNSQVKIERNKDLRYESALSPFLMRKKGR